MMREWEREKKRYLYLKTVFVYRRSGVRYAQKRVKSPSADDRVVNGAGQFAGFDAHSRRHDVSVLWGATATVADRQSVRDGNPYRGHGYNNVMAFSRISFKPTRRN